MVDTRTAIVKLLPLLVEEPLERIDHFPQLPAARAAPAGNGVVRGDDAVQLHRRILPAPRHQVEDTERGLSSLRAGRFSCQGSSQSTQHTKEFQAGAGGAGISLIRQAQASL